MKASGSIQLSTVLVILSLMAMQGILASTTLWAGHYETYSRSLTISQRIVSERSLDYAVVILMENQNFGSIIGNLTTAPYLNRLANDYGVASAYYDVSNNYSLPNYLGLTTGQTFGSWSACNKSPLQCPGFVPITSRTIVDAIENSGLTWKAYMESMPSNCYQSDSGLYVARHNPFAYFARVTNNPPECDLVVPAGDNASRMVADLSSTSTASNFMWLTPNICNDMHSCPVSTGDKYLSRLIPQILNSTVFQNNNGAIFLTWDEGYGRIYNHVPAIWAGPAIVSNSTSTVRHNHYSLLRTLEALWHMPPLTSNDAGASPMTEFFKTPAAGFTYTPSSPQTNQTVTFEGNASGGIHPYSFNWTFGDGEAAIGTTSTHAYETAGSYRVTLAVTDALNHTGTFSQSVNLETVAAQPPPTVKTPSGFWLLDRVPLGLAAISALITISIGLYTMRSRAKAKEDGETSDSTAPDSSQG